jgi:NTP pyrophosphatase (non-canonical NTP hydrolase)
MKPYAIGSEHLPGLGKLIEEAGEVQQVAGKILGVGGMTQHWDGTDLRERMTEELADLAAAAIFFAQTNGLDMAHIHARAEEKVALFREWHGERLAKGNEDAMQCPGTPLLGRTFSGCNGSADCPVCKGEENWLFRLAERALTAERKVKESARTYQWVELDSCYVLHIDVTRRYEVPKYSADDGSTEEALHERVQRLRDNGVLRPIDRVLMPREKEAP